MNGVIRFSSVLVIFSLLLWADNGSSASMKLFEYLNWRLGPRRMVLVSDDKHDFVIQRRNNRLVYVLRANKSEPLSDEEVIFGFSISPNKVTILPSICGKRLMNLCDYLDPRTMPSYAIRDLMKELARSKEIAEEIVSVVLGEDI
ncbi:MAG: hypothetical protein Q8Q92_01025 [bacterium]|nr:hypothetical protein [bacterium]